MSPRFLSLMYVLKRPTAAQWTSPDKNVTRVCILNAYSWSLTTKSFLSAYGGVTIMTRLHCAMRIAFYAHLVPLGSPMIILNADRERRTEKPCGFGHTKSSKSSASALNLFTNPFRVPRFPSATRGFNFESKKDSIKVRRGYAMGIPAKQPCSEQIR